MHLDYWGSIAAIVSAAVAVLSIILGAIVWVLKLWLHEQLRELRPNGGGSMLDLVRKMNKRLTTVEGALIKAGVLALEDATPDETHEH
jgi:hypothetical protein